MASLLIPALTGHAATSPAQVLVEVSTSTADLPATAQHLFDNWYLVPSPTPRAAATASELRLLDGVLSAAPLREVQINDDVRAGPTSPVARALAGVPNDPFYGFQWNIPAIDVPELWDVTRGDGVTVAVLDTGIAKGLDLACHTLATGYNAFTKTSGPTVAIDDNWHGTHMSGTVGQCTDNGIGVAGVADEVQLMPVKVLNSEGSGTEVTVALGIEWARTHGADVINLSLGFSDCTGDWDDNPICISPIVAAAIQNALDDDIVVVAASGNEGGFVSFPANQPGTLAVGAVEDDLSRWPMSNKGSDLDVVAPGFEIVQETLNPIGPAGFGYWQATGTSSAASHVSGLAALLRSIYPYAPAPNVVTAIRETTVDLGPSGRDPEYGTGLVDADSAADSVYLDIERWWGKSRYETAAAISGAGFPAGAAKVYVASGQGFADSLPAGAAAGAAGGPLLLVAKTSIPQVVQDEFVRLAPAEIVVAGGPLVVSDAVVAQLGSLTGATVVRAAGPNRYATSAQIATGQFSGPVDAVFVASGLGFADGVSAGPPAIANGAPLLLTDSASLPAEVSTALTSLQPAFVYVVGGPLAVSESVLSQIESVTGSPVIRVSGNSRFETAKKLSETFFVPGSEPVGVVSGLNFPDALTLGPALGGPILLSNPSALPAPTVEALDRLEPDRIVIAGGRIAISAQLALDLADYVVPGPAE